MDSAERLDAGAVRKLETAVGGRIPSAGHVAGTGLMPPGGANHELPHGTIETPVAANENERNAGAKPNARAGGNVAGGKPTFDDRAIRAFSTVQGVGSSVWGLQMLAIPALVLGYVAAGFNAIGLKPVGKALETLRAGSRMLTEGAHHTLENVTLRAIHKAPGVLMRQAAKIAAGEVKIAPGPVASAQVGPHYLQKLATPLANRADDVDRVMTGVAKRSTELFKPVRRTLTKGITWFGDSAVGRGITHGSKGLMEWRSNRVAAKLAPSLENAQNAFVQKSRSPWQFMRRQPALSTPMPSAFQEAHALVQSAAGLAGHERATVLTQAAEALRIAAEGNAELISHAGTIQGKLAKAAKAATKSAHLGDVLEGGVASWLRNAGHSVGKMKLSTAMVLLFVAGTAGIATFMARKKGAEAKRELRDFTADVGDPASALVKATAQKNSMQAVGRTVGAMVKTAGAATVLNMGAGPEGMAMVPLQMGLDNLGETLTGENATLAAHAALKKHETGVVPLDGKARVQAMITLVAAEPNVAKNGGEYNQLTHRVAEELVARNMPLRDVMHLLNNPAEFNTLAAEVKAKQEAAKAAATAEAAAAPANDSAAGTSAEANDNAPMRSVMAPSSSIAVSMAEHQGRVDATQRRRA